MYDDVIMQNGRLQNIQNVHNYTYIHTRAYMHVYMHTQRAHVHMHKVDNHLNNVDTSQRPNDYVIMLVPSLYYAFHQETLYY